MKTKSSQRLLAKLSNLLIKMKMATMKFELKEQVLSYDKPNLKLESDIAISHNILCVI
jgi:hypothetical protein